MDDDQILLGDNMELLPSFPDGSFQLIYIDPPFNTGRPQRRQRLRTVADPDGDRTGYAGRRYRSEHVPSPAYATATTTTSVSWSRGCGRRGGCSTPPARSTSTSTRASRTT